MATLYKKYLTVKNKLCLSYFGVFNEFVRQLVYLRPAIEAELPGLELYIACQEDLKNDLNCDRVITRSEMQLLHFAYIKDLTFDQIKHPVLELLNESNLTLKHLIPVVGEPLNKTCAILSKGMAPVRSLSESQLNQVKSRVIAKGFELTDDVDSAGWVVGVECDALYKAACQGVATSLVPTGFGIKLFQLMFPQNEILSITAI
jgi:hypothetical protein